MPRASSLFRLSSTLLLTLAVASCGNNDPAAPTTPTQPSAQAAAAADPAAAPLLTALQKQLDGHRRIIVLLADEAQQSAADRATSSQIGQQLFHDGLEQRQAIAALFNTLLSGSAPQRFTTLGTVLDYIESAPELYDADRLAFREVLRDLHERIGADSSLPAVKLHQRIGEDLEALDEIERNYNQEITRIFSRFERTRAIALKREKWDDYIAHLHKQYTREAILRDYGVIEPYPMSMKDSDREVFGRDLPPKTVVLTFDDGPHKAYTDEVVAILKRYDVPGVFFEVGRNLGEVHADGSVKLGPLAGISRNLMDQGYAVGNHSLTHAQLSRTTGDALREQVLATDTLLKDVDKRRAPLFRFPYGARNAEGLQLLNEAGLKSIMWNIDSMDWADPVPESIVQRVVDQVQKEQRGIILFHDIHDRAVKALPQILDRLIAEGYQFAGWNGREFTVSRPRSAAASEATVTTGYEKSWAIVIGIDEYAKWPRLEYASHDAQAIADTLTGQFKFPSSQVIVLKDKQATRNNILAAFHDRLADDRTGRNDRVFVFFAGHGATRRLASGRDLGYIIPVDSDPNEFATDAIAMTDIQNIAESMQAKHVMFVMDACYSGLGLTRGRPIVVRVPARERQAQRTPDAHRRRQRPAGRRQRPERPLGVHLGAAAGAGRQGRPQWRRPDHRYRAGRVCGAGSLGRVAADPRVRQPARFAGWRVRVPGARQPGIPQRRYQPAFGRCDRAQQPGRCRAGRQAAGRGAGDRGRPAGRQEHAGGAGGGADLRPPARAAGQRPRPAAVSREALRRGRGAVYRSPEAAP
jgi:peptidoglycan/xylan/chitin deacetylase (PgdA/CDA1 family)